VIKDFVWIYLLIYLAYLGYSCSFTYKCFWYIYYLVIIKEFNKMLSKAVILLSAIISRWGDISMVESLDADSQVVIKK